MGRRFKNMPGYEYDYRKKRWVKSSLGALGLETLTESDYRKDVATNFLSNMHLSRVSMKDNITLVVNKNTPGVEIDDGEMRIVNREAYLKHMLGVEDSFDLPQDVIDGAEEWGDDVNAEAFKEASNGSFMLTHSNMNEIAIHTIESKYGMDEISFQGEIQKLGDRFTEEAKDDLIAQYKDLMRLRDIGLEYGLHPATIKDVKTGEVYSGYCVSDHYFFNNKMSKVCSDINATGGQIAFYYKNGEIVPNIKHLKQVVMVKAEEFSQNANGGESTT